MNIAIEGCLHGELTQIYKQLQNLQQASGIKIDLLLICGDFQAIRDSVDLDHLHCPPKYKKMGEFCDYFNGKKEAPYLTIFIGGNHEAVNYMRQLYFGGWIAPKIYYLGQAGSLIVNNKKTGTRIRISGMSGIYNEKDFQYILKTQRIPLYGKSRISAYHIKQLETFRLELFSRILFMKKLNPQIYGKDSYSSDFFISHDWPKDIAFYGNLDYLYQYKSFLKKEIDSGKFGSSPLKRILKVLRPAYWFSAHMHIKYPAIFPHPEDQYTHFLSLDKCLPQRHCLQLLKFKRNQNEQTTIPENIYCQNKDTNQIEVYLDPVWLSVLKLTIKLQFQNHTFYRVQENQINLLDGKLMNQLIQKYGQLHSQIQKYSFQNLYCSPDIYKKSNKYIDQTAHLLTDILAVNPDKFLGLIFPHQKSVMEPQIKGYKQKQQREQQNDQIQLDL